MKVLGVSCYFHDAAACLYVDGRLVAAAEEERFTRVKHDASFPENSVRECLRIAGVTPQDLDSVVFHEKPLLKFERILSSCLAGAPRSFPLFRSAMHSWLGEKLWLPATIRARTGHRGEVLYLTHHLSHAASAFLPSPFDEAAILTVDGVGEWTTTAIGHGRGSDVEMLREIRFPHSLGLLYSVITGYLGFEVNEGEYKVMALAGQGERRYDGAFADILRIASDASYRLDLGHFGYQDSLTPWRDLLEKKLGPPRMPEAAIEQRHADIAASLQGRLIEAILALVEAAHREAGGTRLAMAGGVALNVVANREILQRSRFRELFIPPAPGDSGAAVGAAAYVSHSVLGESRVASWDSAALGTGYDRAEIASFLSARGIPHEVFETEEATLQRVADLISENRVVGWFHGRMEFGPRALGSRSILANAANPRMKEIVNERIKYREPFRPFGPALPRAAVSRYFVEDVDSPFMLIVSPVRRAYADQLRAVTNVDGTARLQTVTEAAHPTFHRLLEHVGARTGMPIVLNTSFNVRGEPIVRTPEEAYSCFSATAMDNLVLWPFVLGPEAKRDVGTKVRPSATTDAWLT